MTGHDTGTSPGRRPSAMVVVPAGPFLMGSDEFEREGPPHSVDLPAFWIDRFPVTNDDHDRFVQAAGHRRPVQVTWTDAAAHAAWSGKRLASEAEWEKAARGTDGRQVRLSTGRRMST